MTCLGESWKMLSTVPIRFFYCLSLQRAELAACFNVRFVQDTFSDTLLSLPLDLLFNTVLHSFLAQKAPVLRRQYIQGFQIVPAASHDTQNDSRTTVTPRTVEQLQTRGQDDAIPEWDVPCQNACCTCQVLELAFGGGWTMVDFFLWPDGVSSLNHTTSVLGGSWRQVSPSILWGRQWLVGATILESTP